MQGVTFCDGETKSTIGGTSANIQAVSTIYDEVVGVFSDPWVHIGGDEVAECANSSSTDCCTVAEIHEVESAVQKRLISTHQRTPMGWNEAGFVLVHGWGSFRDQSETVNRVDP